MHGASKSDWPIPQVSHRLPENFTFARVTDVAALGPVFLRVSVESPNLSTHGDAAIHFRLVLPNILGSTAWPGVATNGSVKWEQGDDAPHRPVYTARSVDQTNGTLIFDVFIHEGGRTTDWAQALQNGDQTRAVVGVLGPAGGGLMDAHRVILAADETGFPAAARILENLPPDATGELLLEAQHGAACVYPLPKHAGFQVRWLSRSKGDELGTATRQALPQWQGANIWFAGEREQANAVRDAAIQAGWSKDQLRISGFWRAAAPE
ncbi:MAG: siderophore-interacting protein [Pseudomonadota bacterium]